MPAWIPRSMFGALLAAIYIAAAVSMVVSERTEKAGGGFITLRGFGTFLVTLPVSFVGEKLGIKPDFRNNLHMTVAIGLCALLVYLVGALLGAVARAIFGGAGSG